MTKATFAFVDANFTISQHLQMLAIRTYANSRELSVTFYGVEVAGWEQGHLLLNNYITNRNETVFLFFSMRQFMSEENYLQIELLKKLLYYNKEIHFANESIKITTIDSLLDLIVLTNSYSIEESQYSIISALFSGTD